MTLSDSLQVKASIPYIFIHFVILEVLKGGPNWPDYIGPKRDNPNPPTRPVFTIFSCRWRGLECP